jgi:hypothetical protein
MRTGEVAALSGLDEGRVRKEVEQGIVAQPSFTFSDLVYCAVLAVLGRGRGGVGARERGSVGARERGSLPAHALSSSPLPPRIPTPSGGRYDRQLSHLPPAGRREGLICGH